MCIWLPFSQFTNITTERENWQKLNKLIICAAKADKKRIYDEKNDMMGELLKIDPKKATVGNNIPSKTLKLIADISADILQNLFNYMLKTGNFPDNMKLADSSCIQEKRPFEKGKL